MRVLIITGDHPRHLHYATTIAKQYPLAGVIIERREHMLPDPPAGLPEQDRVNFVRHFADRARCEQTVFGSASLDDLHAFSPLFVAEEAVNTAEAAAYVRKCAPDIVLIFGAGLIKEPLFSALPFYKINLHLGLSPWYRGNATLFWPFYNLEPNWAGATLHIITPGIDDGPMIAHAIPELRQGDGVHDVGVRTVSAAAETALKMLDMFKSRGELPLTQQKSPGRLYRMRDFRPAHLRVIYDLFDNRIVDRFMDGTLRSAPPKLLSL